MRRKHAGPRRVASSREGMRTPCGATRCDSDRQIFRRQTATADKGGETMEGSGKGGGGAEPSTHLVIPYYSGDQGVRPLPAADPFWMCNAIKINGSPYAGQTLLRGETVALTVDAINFGTLTSPALCLIFWASPTTVFTSRSLNLIGQAALPLYPGLPATTAAVPWTVPGETPDHICLLAEVTAPADPAPPDYDAATDRHFGQQNVYLMAASPGGQIHAGFVVANGRSTAARFRLEASHVLVRHRALRHIVKGDAAMGEAEVMGLAKAQSGAHSRSQMMHVELDPGELVDVELNARVPRDADRGSVIVLQVAQYEQGHHNPLGGLGIVVRVT
jgi:hypothetical protein